MSARIETLAPVKVAFDEITVFSPAIKVLLVMWVLPELITVFVESEWIIKFALNVYYLQYIFSS